MANKNIFVLSLLLIIITGCATVTERESSAQVKIAKGRPVIYVHPASLEPYTQASICIPAFVVPSHMDKNQAGRIAGLFKEVFLGKRTFPKVKQMLEKYGNNQQAIEIGKRAGTDLVLAGTVNYALEGTELGGARVELDIRILNVASGNTVWYISQNMDQPIDYPNNSLLSRTIQSLSPPTIKRANGGPAVANMLSQIAVDMADIMAGSQSVRR